MPRTFASTLLFLSAGLAFSQTSSTRELTARELFYAAVEKPSTPKTPTAPARKTQRQPKAPEVAVNKTPSTQPSVAPPRAAPIPTNDVPVIPVGFGKRAPLPVSGPPLGLKYSILKLVDGRMVEVDPNATFHAGDRIRLSITSNTPGYLYIIHQASSGVWKPMFPSSEVEDGNNFVDGLRSYDMPPGTRFFFDEQPGIEKLFIVLSRTPEPDLEKMIYNLRDGGKAPGPAATPASEPAPQRPARVMLASAAPIEDSMVGRLRGVYARDLVIEKVEDEAPTAGAAKEKAVYVVNPSGSANSRVVADIRLTHK